MLTIFDRLNDLLKKKKSKNVKAMWVGNDNNELIKVWSKDEGVIDKKLFDYVLTMIDSPADIADFIDTDEVLS